MTAQLFTLSRSNPNQKSTDSWNCSRSVTRRSCSSGWSTGAENIKKERGKHHAKKDSCYGCEDSDGSTVQFQLADEPEFNRHHCRYATVLSIGKYKTKIFRIFF